MPAFPGAHHIWVMWRDCASFHTNACSRQPEPMTRSFTLVRTGSLNLVVRPNSLPKDALRTFVLHKLEDDPQVISSTASPGAIEHPLELVSFQPRMKRVLREQFKG